MSAKRKVWLLFKTDHHHRYGSRDLIGVYTSHNLLMKDCKKIVKKEDKDEDISWHMDFLLKNNQTQGLASFELVIEENDLNIIF